MKRLIPGLILAMLAANASASEFLIRQKEVRHAASGFTIGPTGNVHITGDCVVDGSITPAIAEVVDDLDVPGDATVGGTLGVTGGSTLAAVACTTLAPSGDVAVATNKFTVAAASGNTVVAGTLGVTGVATLTAVPVLPTGGLTAGTTTITEAEIGVLDSLTATKVEIQNACDVSAQLQQITGAGAVTVDGTKRRATLSGGAYAITLAAPGAGAVGALLVIEYVGGDTDEVTLALTNVVGGSAGTSASFNADGEILVLIGAGSKWVVLKEVGVTLS